MSGPSTRVALVTGTSSGIGEAVARELVERDWNVVGASRRPGTIESPRYTHVQLDLSDVEGLEARIDEKVGDRISGPTVSRVALVNSAADPGILGTVDKIDPVQMLRVYAVNVARWAGSFDGV